MNARHFKIGNFVNYNGNECVIVNISKDTIGLDLGVVSDGHSHRSNTTLVNIKQIQPITLTQDKLTEFGYINTIENYWSNGNLEIRLYDNFVYEFLVSSGRSALLELLYVHQLQNLYFSLFQNDLFKD